MVEETSALAKVIHKLVFALFATMLLEEYYHALIQKGKKVLFSYEHLVQFLACRYLLEEGYALKRIADDLQTSSLDVILSWIPGEDNDRAMGLIRKFKASEPSIERACQVSLALMPMRTLLLML